MNRTFTTIALQSVVAAAIIAAAPLAAAANANANATVIDPGADHVVNFKPFVSTVSRDQVRAEALAAARVPLTVTDSQHAPALPALEMTAAAGTSAA